MESKVLIINPDNCYTIDYSEFDKYKYLGPVVYAIRSHLFWINNCYKTCVFDDLAHLEKNTHIYCSYNFSQQIPNNTEILIGAFSFNHLLNLPEGLKVICWYTDIISDLSKINLPFGLKNLYLISKNGLDTNRIKVPFGCNIINFKY